MAKIIDGRKIANSMKMALKRDLGSMRTRQKSDLRLAVLQIGRDPSSEAYMNAQKKLAGELGVKYYLKALKASTSQKTAEGEIARLNKNKDITRKRLFLDILRSSISDNNKIIVDPSSGVPDVWLNFQKNPYAQGE